MERFTGLLGIALILGLAFLLSNNRKAINYRVVGSGLLIQLLTALFVLKVPLGKQVFSSIGAGITALLAFSDKAASFVFGVLVDREALTSAFGGSKSFIFVFNIVPTIIFVSVLVSIAYHIGLMQRLVSGIAWLVYRLMKVSGAEALSNVASAFVGQVEAQIMIKPYLHTMTMSEMLASMSGSMACIAGGVMAVYIKMGVPAEYLLAASLMAAPGALVISKIVYPETEESQTRGMVKLDIKSHYSNLMDAIAHGASDGMRVAINVIAMLLGFIALIWLVDAGLNTIGGWLYNGGLKGQFMGGTLNELSLKTITGGLFSIFAFAMGVPAQDAFTVGSLMGTKMVVNEFVAYFDMTGMMAKNLLSPKSIVIASFALCGFANFSSIAIQVGGIGELAPERRRDLSKLGIKALICGTLASYLSATLAGILL